jgi:translation initiation factor 3 subunit M
MVCSVFACASNNIESILTIIQVIRAGLLSGKLSQTTQTLHVTRSTARTFEREQWEALEKRLSAWKVGLASVLDVVVTARKRAETPQAVPVTTTTAQTQTQLVTG